MVRLCFIVVALFSSVVAHAYPNCAVSDVAAWKSYSMEQIKVEPREFTATSPRLRKLEEGVLINAKITKAYAALYREEKDKQGEDELSPYLWLPAAAFASFEVGQIMRHGFLAIKKKQDAFGTRTPPVYWENPLKEIFIVGRLSLTNEQVSLYLAMGNQGVYKDLFWQHLSTAKCGVDTTIRLLEKQLSRETTSKERERYSVLAEGWRELKQGMVNMDFDAFEKANQKLTMVEQKMVLQPLIYDGPLGQLGGSLFGKLAMNPVHDEHIQSRSFTNWCLWNLKLPNFSHFETRWGWMMEQLHEMYVFFNGPHAHRARLHHLFMIEDSRKVLMPSQQLAASY